MERSPIRRPILVAAALQILAGPWCQAAMAVQPLQMPVQTGAPLSGAAVAGASLGTPGSAGVSLTRQAPALTQSLPALQSPALSRTPALTLPAPVLDAAAGPSLRAAAGPALNAVPGAAPKAVAQSRPAASVAGVLYPSGAVSQAPTAGAPGQLLPHIDFSAFSPESLSRMPAAGGPAPGAPPQVPGQGHPPAPPAAAPRLMDRILGIRGAARKGAVDAPQAPAVSRKKGPTLEKAAAEPSKKPFDPMNRPFSPYRLSMFEYDPEAYALTFLFGKEDKSSPQGYELLIGLAVHQTLEKVYTWIAQGRDGKSISLDEVLAEYDAAWAKEKAAGRYRVRDGWTDADYKRRGKAFIARKFELLAPFDAQGKVLALEQTVLWTMKDPVTGKSYDFKGKIDRLMIKDDTVYIRDWKTYFNPPSLAKLERDDYQLGLYALALRAARPDLVQGRKIKLVWDYKEFTQEITVDDAYLAKVEGRVLRILRAIETFKERVEAERPEWEKRLKPDARPAGLQAAKKAVDRLGAIQAELADKKEELRKLDKEYGRLEEGIARYGKEQGIDSVQGKTYSATIARKSERTVPTKTDDPEGNEAVVKVLQDGKVWEKYSSLDAAAVRRMAELQGGEDRAAFEKIRADLRSEHANGLEVSAKDAAGKGQGGVARTKLPREAWAPDAEPGLLSATQLATFLADREDYVKRYLLRMRADMGPKPMGFLAGSAIHETMERLYIWIKGGKIAADLTLADLLKYFEGRWKELRDEGDFRPDPGVTPEEYKRGAKDYIRAKWKQLFPFDDQGRVLYLEQRMHFALTDPQTGRTYKFQGIPDRVMMDGDTIVIRDWKSHYKAPTDEEVKAKDYQLGLYLLAMRQLYPDLMRGKKGRLIWDFKEKETVIDVDDAYLADLEKRLFAVLREMDALREDFESNRASWEDRLKPPDLPKNRAEAGARVDRMGELAARMKALDGSVKALKAESSTLEEQVIAFSRQTGHVAVEGKSHASRLTKKGTVSVPTQGKEKEAYDRVVSILKDAGIWAKYSKMEYRALKKAMADPKNPDREVLKKVEPLLREVRETTVSLSELDG